MDGTVILMSILAIAVFFTVFALFPKKQEPKSGDILRRIEECDEVIEQSIKDLKPVAITNRPTEQRDFKGCRFIPMSRKALNDRTKEGSPIHYFCDMTCKGCGTRYTKNFARVFGGTGPISSIFIPEDQYTCKEASDFLKRIGEGE